MTCERIRAAEARIIGGKAFIVETVEELSFSGEWELNGYRVFAKDDSHIFVGYPSDADIEKQWKKKGENQ